MATIFRAEQSRAEQSRAEQSRAEHIDIFRGLGIIFMVMGHIGFGAVLDKFIHAFHMPMFFFISGMFLRVNGIGFRAFLYRKARSILVPYFAFGFFNYVVWLLRHRDNMSIEPLLNLLWVNNNSGLPIAGALWFLTASFFSITMFYILDRYIRSRFVSNLSIILIAIFGCICATILPFRLPWSLGAAFVGVGFVKIGNLTRDAKYKRFFDLAFSLKPLPLAAFAVATVVLIFLNTPVNMRTSTYGFIPLFWINAVLAIIVGINISKYIQEKVTKVIWGRISYIGKYSIVFLGLNQLVILYLKEFASFIGLSILPSKLFTLFLSIPILYGCVALITKTKLRFIIGK